MSRQGDKSTASDFEFSEQFRCALTRNGRKRRGKLSWLSQGMVTLTKQGVNEIELDVDKAKTNHPYKLSAHNLCGLETGRILVPSSKPFCCQRRHRKESHYVLIAMDDNCGDHPIILLTNPDNQIINHWKWHLQNTLAFVNSWPNLELTYIRDDHADSHRVTLMLTKIWLSVFKFQRFKLPQLWHRIRIANIHDMFFESDTATTGKKQLNIICHKGVLRIISSRNEEIFTNIDALWRVPLENPRMLAHPNAPPLPAGDASDTSSIHPRSDHTAPGGNSSDSMLSGKTDNRNGSGGGGESGNSGNSGSSHGPGCAIHQPLILDLMEKQPDSTSRISVSCTSCLQSGNFEAEDETDEKPPHPCVGGIPTGEYIDRPRYLPMAGFRRPSQVSIPDASQIGELNVANEGPVANTPDSGIVVPNGGESPLFTVPPQSPLKLAAPLETIQSEAEDTGNSMEISMKGDFSSLDDPYSMARSPETLAKPQETAPQGLIETPESPLPPSPQVKSRFFDPLLMNPKPNHSIADRRSVEVVNAPKHIVERKRSNSECAPRPEEAIHVHFPVYAESAKITRRHKAEMTSSDASPPSMGCQDNLRKMAKREEEKQKKKKNKKPNKSTSLPRGCFRPFGSHYYSIFNFNLPERRFYDMNILSQEMQYFEREDAERVVKLMSHSLVTKAQFPSGSRRRNHYISMETDYIPADQDECKKCMADESGSSDNSEGHSPVVLRPNRKLRRCNSLDNPWRSRPSSSLYVYWSATNIVHTLHRSLRGTPPKDTLGLSTSERKELCMRLYTPSVDQGMHDWRALGERIGLAEDAMWLIDNFQRSMFSKDTAGEIILKHWQFCYNTYGVHEDKCPVACTRKELIRLLIDMGRQDLIDEVFSKHGIAALMPQEHTSASGAKENTWCDTSDTIGRANPAFSLDENIGQVNRVFSLDESGGELGQVRPAALPLGNGNVGQVNRAFSLDESFENVDGITAPRHATTHLDLRGDDSEFDTDTEMFNSLSPTAARSPTSPSAGYFSLGSQLLPGGLPSPKSGVGGQTPETGTMPVIPETGYGSIMPDAMDESDEPIMARCGDVKPRAAVKPIQNGGGSISDVQRKDERSKPIDNDNHEPSSIAVSSNVNVISPSTVQTKPSDEYPGGARPKINMNTFPGEQNPNAKESTGSDPFQDKVMQRDASKSTNYDGELHSRLHKPEVNTNVTSGQMKYDPFSTKSDQPKNVHGNQFSNKTDALSGAKIYRPDIPLKPEHVSIHVSASNERPETSLVSQAAKLQTVDKDHRPPPHHKDAPKVHVHRVKNELMTELVMRDRADSSESIQRRKKRLSSGYITKSYPIPSESRPTSALHMAVPVSIDIDDNQVDTFFNATTDQKSTDQRTKDSPKDENPKDRNPKDERSIDQTKHVSPNDQRSKDATKPKATPKSVPNSQQNNKMADSVKPEVDKIDAQKVAPSPMKLEDATESETDENTWL